MSLTRIALLFLTLFLLIENIALGQSLGDVAKKEKARRKSNGVEARVVDDSALEEAGRGAVATESSVTVETESSKSEAESASDPSWMEGVEVPSEACREVDEVERALASEMSRYRRGVTKTYEKSGRTARNVLVGRRPDGTEIRRDVSTSAGTETKTIPCASSAGRKLPECQAMETTIQELRDRLRRLKPTCFR